MKDYEKSPKREPMRKRGVRIGSLTAHRRWVAPSRNRAHKVLKGKSNA
jgi:hypothetical protein